MKSAAGRNVVEVIENKGRNAVVCAERCLGFRELVATKEVGCGWNVSLPGQIALGVGLKEERQFCTTI